MEHDNRQGPFFGVLFLCPCRAIKTPKRRVIWERFGSHVRRIPMSGTIAPSRLFCPEALHLPRRSGTKACFPKERVKGGALFRSGTRVHEMIGAYLEKNRKDI